MSDDLRVERTSSTTTITINRPHRLNALDFATMVRLGDLIETESQQPGVRVLVLTGESGAFCSGADLAAASRNQADNDPAYTAVDGISAANRIVKAILSAPVPVVARVPGPAVGVGVPIALAADVVIASENAYFLLAFTKVGLMPDGGASLLVAASIGRARALSMALLGTRLPATEAVAAGLIDRVVPVAELDREVRDVVDKFVAGPRQAFALTKYAINLATLGLLGAAMDRELDGQARLLGSPDFLEGATAMLQRRKPTFTD